MKRFLLEEGSVVNNSQADGPVYLDRYSCVMRSNFGGYNGIGCFTYVRNSEVGRYTHFGARVSIGGAKHPLDWASIGSFQYRDSPWGDFKTIPFEEGDGARIGNDVWVGDNSVIMSGVNIETGCVVGAGSIVTKDLPPYTIAVGNPARRLRMRFNEIIIEQLLECKWWQKSIQELDGLPFNKPEDFLAKYRNLYNL